ncbi:18236_t:CDS:1, partial [Gigaspora rosea]
SQVKNRVIDDGIKPEIVPGTHVQLENQYMDRNPSKRPTVKRCLQEITRIEIILDKQIEELD